MTEPEAGTRPVSARAIDRQVIKLAVPALGVLIAEPLFLLGDAVVVSYLGTPEVSGLGAAGAVLATLVNVCVFLAYGTTAAVARHMGAEDAKAAVGAAADGVALALSIGVVLGAVCYWAAPWLVDAVNVADAGRAPAVAYLRIAALGIPSMLVVLAATGVLRGLMDMRAPLWIVGASAAANLVLNVVLVFPAGLGIEGSALGTVATQTAMAAIFLWLLRRRAHGLGYPLRPTVAGIRASLGTNFALLARTVALRVYLLVAIWVAGGMGVAALAAYTLANTIWNLLALALDALAIAAQVLIADARGAGARERTRAVAKRLVRLGTAYGCATAVLIGVLAVPIVPLLSPDPAVRALLWGSVLVIGLLQPIAGAVFALDGVLIGAEDATYLAWAAAGCTAVFILAAWPVAALGLGLTALWAAVGVMMVARLVVLGLRVRSDAWV